MKGIQLHFCMQIIGPVMLPLLSEGVLLFISMRAGLNPMSLIQSPFHVKTPINFSDIWVSPTVTKLHSLLELVKGLFSKHFCVYLKKNPVFQ